MSATYYDILIEKGATFKLSVVWKDGSGDPVDLTSYTARMQVRQYAQAPTAALSLTTENGGITLGGTAGTIDLYIDDLATDAITIPKGVYDLELEDASGDVTRLLQGDVEIDVSVTR